MLTESSKALVSTIDVYISMCCSLLSMDNVYFCNKECISRCIYFYVMFPIEKQTYIERISKMTVIVCLGKDSSRFTHNCQVTKGIRMKFSGEDSSKVKKTIGSVLRLIQVALAARRYQDLFRRWSRDRRPGANTERHLAGHQSNRRIICWSESSASQSQGNPVRRDQFRTC